MKDYKKLLVWQKAHQLVLKIYKRTKSFPKEETYGLTSQIRRAVISVATNIVEGTSRKSQIDFSRFLQISFGSAKEVEYEILLAKDLDYIDAESYNELEHQIEEIKKMLVGLMHSIEKTN